MRIIQQPSPNHDARPDDAVIDMVVLHYTDMRTCAEALARLCDAEARVSAHYCIDEDGTPYALVAEQWRAWHAGVSCWQGARNVNDRSIGIELANPGHQFGYRPFPERQIETLLALLAAIRARHGIPARRILGHSDVAPARKIDPGELFPWQRLAAAGHGLWPQTQGFSLPAPARSPREIAAVQSDLARIGYEVQVTGVADAPTAAALAAFQRHFRPARIDGVADGETRRLIAALVAQLPPA